MSPQDLQERPEPLSVSVVIPHYEDQPGLDAVLAGLRAQDPVAAHEVIVADDGSSAPPRVPAGVRVVRQEDLGFRAAAARNLGAAAATGDVLAFLDGDTVPEPGYLAAVVAALADHPHALVVGTRTHLDDTVDPPRDLGEPQWLRDAWEATDHLRRHDDASFRYVISAVLSCRRETFERLGGFDPAMVGYGGEDWELGWQAVLAGCDLLHVPQARAVHRGADWGGRSAADLAAAAAQKNLESLRLASRITHPIARPAGIVHAVPDVLVTCAWAADAETGTTTGAVESTAEDAAAGATTGAAALTVRDLLASGDVRVHLPVGPLPVQLREMLAADPRVLAPRSVPAPEPEPAQDSAAEPDEATSQPDRQPHTGGMAPPRVRPRFLVELLRPCRIPLGELQEACAQTAQHGGPVRVIAPDGTVLARLSSVRARARAALGLPRDGAPEGGALHGGDPDREDPAAVVEPLRLTRDWPQPGPQTRLEDVFRVEP